MTWRKFQLSTVCTEVDRSENVQPEATYRLLGMRSQIGGPFLRETKFGSELSATKLNKVRTGDFIYSRLFAWQGSFGVIPPELDGCYVSNEFPLFAIDETRLCSRFLTYWFGLRPTQLEVEQHCYGSTPGTRNRFKEVFFKQLMVPVPPLEAQIRVVAKLDQVAKLIEDRKKTIVAVDSDLDALLANAFAQIVEGASYLPMEEVAPLVRRPVDVQPDEVYPELGVRSFGRGIFHKPTLKGSELTWQKLFLVREGDLVFSNIKAWEGAFAVAERGDDGRVGSHRYLTCVPAPGLATAPFVCYYLQTREGIEKVQAASPGSADRNRTLGQKRLAAITVPTPSIERQRWFDDIQSKVRELGTIRAETANDIDALLPSMLHEIFGNAAPGVKQPTFVKSAEPTLRIATG